MTGATWKPIDQLENEVLAGIVERAPGLAAVQDARGDALALRCKAIAERAAERAAAEIARRDGEAS